mmetsp:Transcript_114772/g.324361  ORF Transcript_114772/g.324361 Transcript_114772/m.324361 type:complete len:202 (-) Transcript_114772:107-712(-)
MACRKAEPLLSPEVPADERAETPTPGSPSGDSLKFRVTRVGGDEVGRVCLAPQDTLLHLQHLIAEESGIPVAAQQLLLDGLKLHGVCGPNGGNTEAALSVGEALASVCADADREQSIDVTLVVKPPEHEFEHGTTSQCCICVECGFCTWGAPGTCINDLPEGRKERGGEACGCGVGTPVCTHCKVCPTCAKILLCSWPIDS